MRYDVLESLISIALKAGSLVRHYYGSKDFKVAEKKDNHDLVTDVDLESQKIIIAELSGRFPEIPIVGEEGQNALKRKHAFFVDPLDGTLNFVKKLPFFTVSIGYSKDNQPVCGVVYDPLRQDIFYGRAGYGAYHNGNKLEIRKSNNKGHMLASDWGHDPRYFQKNIMAIQQLLKENSYLFRFMGCASLAICYVAAGIVNGYWHYTLSPWDMAAGVLIAQEAGASVTLIDGQPFNLWHKDLLVIEPHLKESVLPVFKKIEN